MSQIEIVVKGPDRLSAFMEIVSLYDTPNDRTLIKVEGEDGAAFISGRFKKVKILTFNWSGLDPEDFPGKNSVLR